MPLTFTKTKLPGVFLIEPVVFRDDRGFFMETYHYEKYRQAGIDTTFVQDNYSHSRKGILRGLHYQLKNPQAKLVYVITGEIFDVAVDVRGGSSTFGQWVGVRLSQENKRQMYIPQGFAHGFCVLSKTADVIYKCTDLYAPDDEYGVIWSDPAVGITWPVKTPIVSEKDSLNPQLGKIAKAFLPL